jgi:hypothetical protein
VERRSHVFFTTALEVRGYIHVPTVLPIGKSAVYTTRESVPQGKSAGKKGRVFVFYSIYYVIYFRYGVMEMTNARPQKKT